jgi:predicted dithiol-disulfide oxidoreductase (DUF899 family)
MSDPNPILAEVRALEQQIMSLTALHAALRRKAFGRNLKNSILEGPAGQVDLRDLITAERPKLLLIVNMGVRCNYCMAYADGIAGVSRHLGEDLTVVLASGSPVAEIATLREKRQWPFACYSFTSPALPEELGLYDANEGVMPGIAGLSRGAESIIVTAINDFEPGDVFAPLWHLRALVDPAWDGLSPKGA